ncbi:MAG TPA: sigma-70 family RNA polymerase sigma factor [Anaerolineales bacterium]|jgi:RNA polymerase sigma-70 factor (ECF subfamily)
MKTDTSLPKDARQLEKKDLIEIYERYNLRLFQYSIRLLGDAELAEECVAETFSRFLQAVKKGGGPRDNIQAYLYRIAHNWITDFYRNQPPVEPLESHLPADSLESPVAVVTKNMERDRVRNALLQLTPDQRQVILLRFFEEWAHEEIASLIGKSAEATRALQHRALAGLRRMLIDAEA